jgi:hypothetical protein
MRWLQIDRVQFSKAVAGLALSSLLLMLLAGCSFSLEKNNNPSNTVMYATPGENLTQKAKKLTPGSTLILRDGTYPTALKLQNLYGTPDFPIAIHAEHDGKAILDAEGNAENVLLVQNSSYITIEGLVVRNAKESVIEVSSEKTSYITLRRVTAYNAGAGNNNVFSIEEGAAHILIEDCAGWGRGRYIFLAYHVDYVTFRRTWARWEKTDNFSPAPRSTYGAYGSSHILFENVIGYNAIPVDPTDDFYSGVWETSDGPPTENISYLGSIFYNIWGQGIRVNDLGGPFKNTVIKDSYFSLPMLPDKPEGFPNKRPRGIGVEWLTPVEGMITNSVFVNNRIGIVQRAGSPIVTNNVFVNNKVAMSGNLQSSYNVLWQNGNQQDEDRNAATRRDWQVNPGYDTARYGLGAYFFIPPGSPLKGKGEQGSDIGANLIYRYADGKITKQPLWPWSMEERIKAEAGVSVTWENGGGFWKTLEGVYPLPVL